MPTITVEDRAIELHVTKDYDRFNLMRGNRAIDKGHVQKLKNKIEAEGNLTSEFPINVNENLDVIDGQHRVLALKELDYPVFYTITRGAGLSTVRKINVARRNWTWKDYASSYAAEGNMQYKDLLDFHQAFGFGSRILFRYTLGGSDVDLHSYQNGDFRILDKGLTYRLLNQLTELKEAIPFALTGTCAAALYDIMTHPDYDHKRMLKKLTLYSSQLHEWRRKKDWLRNLEDIYNLNQGEGSRARFF